MEQELTKEEKDKMQDHQNNQEIINEILQKRSQKARKSWFAGENQKEQIKTGLEDIDAIPEDEITKEEKEEKVEELEKK